MENATQEKGVALFLVVLIMSVILAIGLGISGILIQQIKISENIGDSVVALYAADSGVEQQIYDLYKLESHNSAYSDVMTNSASYSVSVKCSESNADCQPGGELFGIIPVDENCTSLNFCIKSVGAFQTAKRVIEVEY